MSRITGWDLPKTKQGVPDFNVTNLDLTLMEGKLDDIVTNTGNINVNVGDVEINVNDLEVLQTAGNLLLTSVDARLDSSIGHINNMSDIGSGSDQLRACALGIMPSGNGRILSCDVDGKLDVTNSHFSKITTIDTKLDSYAGAGNNNIGEGSSKLQIFNYGRDVANGIYKPMVVNSSAEQIIALSAVDNAVLDDIKSNTGSIEGCVESNKVNVNISSGGITGFATETTLGNAEAHLGTIDTNIGNAEAHLGTIDTNIGNAEAHLGNIDTGVDVLEACVSSNKVNVNISSGNISGFATETTLDNAEAHLGTIDTNIGNAEAHLGNIDTGIDVLEACVGSNKVNVNISSGNISGFATETTLGNAEAHLGTIDTNIGNAEAHLGNIDTGIDVLEACVGSNKVNVNISSGGFDGAVTGTVTANLSAIDNAVLDSIAADGDAIQGKLDTIDGSINTLEACVGSNKVNVNISSGGFDGAVTGTVTANLSAIDNAVLDSIAADGDAIQGKLDTIDGSINTLEACVGSNKVNVNISSGGFDGAVTGTVTATLSAIDNAVLDAIATDGDNVQTLLTQLDVVADASLVKHTNNETLLTQLDVVADASLVKHTNNETLLTQLDVVADACLVKHTNNETLLTAVSQKLGDIETAVQLLDNCVSGTEFQVDIVSGGNAIARLNIDTGTAKLTDNELSTHADCSAFSEICIAYPTTQTDNQLKLFVKGSTASSGSYFTFANMVRKEFNATDAGVGDTQHYIWGTGNDQYNAGFIPCVYPFIKIENQSGETFVDSDNIRFVGR